MEACMLDATEELKRVDHLIYVSLKYTRTIDVIKNIVERLISTYDCFISALLIKLQQDGKITEIPDSPVQKAITVKNNFEDAIVKENMDLYLLFRKVTKAKCGSAQEYRRHVTMHCELPDGNKLEINIDLLYEYHKISKEFFEFIKKLSGSND